MKILIYDNCHSELEALYNMLINISDEFKIDKVMETKRGYLLYEEHNHDFIFINSDCHHGKNFLNEIHNKNPQQNLIALSDSLNCTDNIKCSFCKQEDNKFLLVRPIYSNDLFYLLLGNNKRPTYCDNNQILKRLKKIDQNFHNFDFCIENKMFVNKNSFLKRDEKVFNLLTQLKLQNIPYEIDSTKNIKILEQEN